jgi:hypothetical protein
VAERALLVESVSVGPHRPDRMAPVVEAGEEIWIGRQTSFIIISKLDNCDRGRARVEVVAEVAAAE